jgi:hypothetical protein
LVFSLCQFANCEPSSARGNIWVANTRVKQRKQGLPCLQQLIVQERHVLPDWMDQARTKIIVEKGLDRTDVQTKMFYCFSFLHGFFMRRSDIFHLPKAIPYVALLCLFLPLSGSDAITPRVPRRTVTVTHAFGLPPKKAPLKISPKADTCD